MCIGVFVYEDQVIDTKEIKKNKEVFFQGNDFVMHYLDI